MTTRRSPLLLEYLEALLIAVVFAVFARTFVAQAFAVPTSSMTESLLAGDHMLVSKGIYSRPDPLLGPLNRVLPQRPVRRGDVVVFSHPRQPARRLVKRCVAVAGDTIEIRDKELWLDGELVDDGAYARHVDPRLFSSSPFVEERYRHRDNFGPYTVPSEHFFVLGDNRDASTDSRLWGALPVESLVGRAFMIYWSTVPATGDAPAAAARDKISGGPSKLARSLANTRWDRCFQLVR